MEHNRPEFPTCLSPLLRRIYLQKGWRMNVGRDFRRTRDKSLVDRRVRLSFKWGGFSQISMSGEPLRVGYPMGSPQRLALDSWGVHESVHKFISNKQSYAFGAHLKSGDTFIRIEQSSEMPHHQVYPSPQRTCRGFKVILINSRLRILVCALLPTPVTK